MPFASSLAMERFTTTRTLSCIWGEVSDGSRVDKTTGNRVRYVDFPPAERPQGNYGGVPERRSSGVLTRCALTLQSGLGRGSA